ncbi:MAG: hypothetical protein ACI4GO_09930 [Hominenteromicrobium sp.]
MSYTFKKTDFAAIRPQVDAYLAALTGPVDDFWENHILRADAYAVCRGAETVGFFCCLQEETPRMTAFWVDNTVSTADSEAIFEKVLTERHIAHAFVATCDELFLSLCMTYQTKAEIQAYFFQIDRTQDTRPAEFGADCMRRVTAGELPEVFALTGDFFVNDLTAADIESGRIELYRAVENGETLGFGVMIPDRLLPDLLPCGEIVLEPHRRRGVARSLQLFMHERCAALGKRHIGGCWFHNKPSRNTFDSAGLYSRTRLLNITF